MHGATYTWSNLNTKRHTHGHSRGLYTRRDMHTEEPWKGHTHRKNFHMKDIYRRDILRILGGAYTQRKIPTERTYTRK